MTETRTRPKLPFPRPPAWLEDHLDDPRPVPPVACIPSCRWCSSTLAHPEHGLPCRETDCRCESSFDHRGDEWRPRVPYWLDRLNGMMDTFGYDGWTATIAATPPDSEQRRRIRQILVDKS